MVPVLDSEQEVEVEIDRGRRGLPLPQSAAAITNRLSDLLPTSRCTPAGRCLARRLGVLDRHRSSPTIRPPRSRYLITCGTSAKVRVTGTHDFAPVFVARAWDRAPAAAMTSVLSDPIWPRGGVVRHQRDLVDLPRDHVMRGLDEFVRVDDGQDVFDASAFDRVLRGFVTPTGAPEPEQFFQGNRLKLPHFSDHASCLRSGPRSSSRCGVPTGDRARGVLGRGQQDRQYRLPVVR